MATACLLACSCVLVGFMLIWCRCQSCALFVDPVRTFDRWEIIAGSWSITRDPTTSSSSLQWPRYIPRLTTSSGDAVILAIDPVSGEPITVGENGGGIHCELSFMNTDNTAVATGSEYRIYFAWQDASNHAYIRVTNSSGYDEDEVELMIVVGGAAQSMQATRSDRLQLAIQSPYYTVNTKSPKVVFSADEVLYFGSIVTPMFGSPYVIYYRWANGLGRCDGRVGFGTGSSSSTSTAHFTYALGSVLKAFPPVVSIFNRGDTLVGDSAPNYYDLAIKYYCPLFYTCDLACDGDALPEEIEVHFSNDASAWGCADLLDQTFVLTRVDNTADRSDFLHDCSEYGDYSTGCLWTYGHWETTVTSGGFTWDVTFQIYAWLVKNISTGVKRLHVRLNYHYDHPTEGVIDGSLSMQQDITGCTGTHTFDFSDFPVVFNIANCDPSGFYNSWKPCGGKYNGGGDPIHGGVITVTI
jgi:hypothetical protein